MISGALYVHSYLLCDIQTFPRWLDWFQMLFGVADHAGECQLLYASTKSPRGFVPQALKVSM